LTGKTRKSTVSNDSNGQDDFGDISDLLKKTVCRIVAVVVCCDVKELGAELQLRRALVHYRCDAQDHDPTNKEKIIMAYTEILYDVSDRLATITLNRPDKLNAWTPTMEKEVRAALTAAESAEDVRIIILTGAGRGFCAGADMQALNTLATQGGAATDRVMARNAEAQSRADVRADFQKQYSYFPAIQKPLIGALNGPVAGLGFVISLYCDLRFASDRARFGTAFARRGLIAEHGVSWLLPRLVGIANACDLLFSARMIEAEEALRMGLVNRIVPHENLLAEVRAYAGELAALVSPRSLRVMKRQIWEAQFQTLAEAIDIANEEMLQSFQSADFKEGVAHFLEKRAPRFTGQ
jgi:enoyl-CoA hydratase/carnithine racemase